MEAWKDELLIPHIVLLNLNPEYKDYKVVWEFNEKIGKWTVGFEETM